VPAAGQGQEPREAAADGVAGEARGPDGGAERGDRGVHGGGRRGEPRADRRGARPGPVQLRHGHLLPARREARQAAAAAAAEARAGRRAARGPRQKEGEILEVL